MVRNRLEHLRQRQRDEALQAQEELLAGVASAASGRYGTASDVPDVVEAPAMVVEEEVEPYLSVMEPPLLDITKLPMEERQIDILTEKEALRALVRFFLLRR